MTNKDRVCPVEKADGLDTRLRRLLQNPRKILTPYMHEGMSAMDFGCGPGFFTIEMARMAGENGRVFAVDLQEGMLEILKKKIRQDEIARTIVLHQSEADKIGVEEKVDFVLVFYVLHELPNQKAFYKELAGIVKPGGLVLIVEPLFHTTKEKFNKSISLSEDFGFESGKRPMLLLSRSAILTKK